MTFLEFPMLVGLALLAVPLLIHLLNRSKARPIAWGAMRFLAASFETQRRRLIVEEMLLLALRCLAVAALVLAMARPFLPSQPSLGWALVLPLFILSAVLAGAAAAVWKSSRTRRMLLTVAVASCAVAAIAAAFERQLQGSSWFAGGGDRDIVVVLDGSESMRISEDGRSNFDRAKEEAAKIVRSCGAGDTAGIVLAGPVPSPLMPFTSADHKEILKILENKDLQPVGGSFGVLESLNAAAAMLGQARNPVKRIVVFTDRQSIGWDVKSQPRWTYLAQSLNSPSQKTKVIVRRFPAPDRFRNAAVAEISLPKTATGVGQPVKIEARIFNGGDGTIQPAAVTLSVNGEQAARDTMLKELQPGTSETVTFVHRFPKAGRSVLTCSVTCDDDLPSDNSLSRVLDINDNIPVLIINGTPSKRAFESSAEFIRLALEPAPTAANAPGTGFPAKPEVVGVDAAYMTDLGKYPVVIVANPPRMPNKLWQKLIDRVAAGGGLLVVPGDRTEPAVFNAIRAASGERFLPASFESRRNMNEAPAHFALKTFTHPALRLCSEASRSDAPLAMIKSYWQLKPDKADAAASVGATLDSGDPFLVERRFGRGIVAMTSFSMDRADSTMPSLKMFVPLLHELVYYLASPASVDSNIRPGVEMIFDIVDGKTPTPVPDSVSTKAEAAGLPAELPVATPSGLPGKATMARTDGHRLFRCSETRWPGLYRIMTSAIQDPPKGADGQPIPELPFVVLSNPEESCLSRLSDDELLTLRGWIDIFPPATYEELVSAATGGAPGQEIWKILMALALGALIAEIALARWIAANRRIMKSEKVDFTDSKSSPNPLRSPASPTGSIASGAAVLPAGLPEPALWLMAALFLWAWIRLRKWRMSGAAAVLPPMVRTLLSFAMLLSAGGALERHLVFATSWPVWAVLLAGAAAAEAVLLLYVFERQSVPKRPGMAIAALRALLVILVAFALCQPVRIFETSRKIDRYAAVLVDSSASMQIPDTGLDPSSKIRIGESLSLLQAQRPVRAEEISAAFRKAVEETAAQADMIASMRIVAPNPSDASPEKMLALLDASKRVRSDVSALADKLAAPHDIPAGAGDALKAKMAALAARVKAETLARLDERIRLLEAAVRPPRKDDQAKAPEAKPPEYEHILSGGARAVESLQDMEKEMSALGGELDSFFYGALPEKERAALDTLASMKRHELATKILLAPQRNGGKNSNGKNLLENISDNYGLKTYSFARDVSELDLLKAAEEKKDQPKDAAAARDPAEIMATDISGALGKAMSDIPSGQLAGILVLTDGRHNASESAAVATGRLAHARVPVCPVAFGSAAKPPKDACVMDVQAPDIVYLNDRFKADVDLKLDGMAGANAVVRLMDGTETVDTRTVEVKADSIRERIQLSDKPKAVGFHSYKVVIDPVEGELVKDNNERLVPANVSDDRIKVLYIEGRPRWEFRYLKNLFSGRDQSVRLQYVLLQPDRIENQPVRPEVRASAARAPGETEATALPSSEGEWMKFDIVILGDVDPAVFGTDGLTSLRKFVGSRGGSLIMIAGTSWMPRAYMDTPLSDLLPAAARRTDAQFVRPPEEGFKLTLTQEGREHPVTQLDVSQPKSAEIWAVQPSFHWRHPIVTAKPGALVLAFAMPFSPPDYVKQLSPSEVPDEDTMKMRRQFELENALIVCQNYSLGRVVLLCTDETWRLRFRTGDTYHHMFWGQLLRWATADKLMSGSSCVRIAPEKGRYSPGEEITVRARITRPDFTPVTGISPSVKVMDGDKEVLTRKLVFQPDSPGIYSGSVGKLPQGSYRILLDCRRLPDEVASDAKNAQAEFGVAAASPAELAELSPDLGAMNRIAAQTGGIVVGPADAAAALEHFGPPSLVQTEKHDFPIWNSWPFLLLLAALAGAEWIIRKKVSLP